MSLELFSIYTDLIAKVLKRIRVKLNVAGVEISFGREAELSIDDRIRKIDKARENLVDGLAAIDELRQSAEQNKKEVQQALGQLAQLEEDKRNLQAKLESTRQIIGSDVQAFRDIAGIPSPSAVRRERVIGFVSGVVASVVASGLLYGVANLIKR